MDRVNAADEEKKQERDEGDEEQERQIGQAPFQPVRRNSAGSEEDLVEVENPEPSRDAQQTKPDGCVSEMQNDVIIHDGFVCSGVDGASGRWPGATELKQYGSACDRFPTRPRYRQDG